MEQRNVSTFAENFTEENRGLDYSIMTLSSLVPGWITVFLVSYIIIAMTIGLPGNSLVLIILLKLKRKTSTDWFVISIALCDFISLSVNGTLHIVTVLIAISSNFLCEFHHYIAHFVFLQSSLLITCMGLDRFVKTCKPHSLFFTPKTSLGCCFVTCVVSALFNISHFFTAKVNVYGKCGFDSTKASIRLPLYGVTLAVVILCSGALCVIYGKIAVQIRKRIKVGTSVITSIRASYTANIYRNETGVLSRSQCNCDSTRHQHATVSYHKGEVAGVSTITVSSRVDKNDDSEQEVCTSSSFVRNPHQDNFCVYGKPQNSVTIKKHQNEKSRTKNNTRPQGDQLFRQVNKTSKTMGAITFVFIISTVIPAVAVSILTVQQDVKKDPFGRVIVFFVLRLYLINNFANPLFYIWLSSEFRKKVIEILKVCKR